MSNPPGPLPRTRVLFRDGPRAALLCVVLASLVACDSGKRSACPSAPPPRFDPSAVNGERALADVGDFIAIAPRDGGTPGAANAARYLAQRLRALDIDPIVEEFSEETPDGTLHFRNVMGVIPGDNDRTIIVASHYDTKSGISGGFAGANDSGSSTGLLLELARALAPAPKRGPDILLVFFDGEECRSRYGPRDGLHGSRHLAKTLIQNKRSGKVSAVIVLDMIGDKDLTVTIPRNCTSRLVSLVFEAAAKEGARLKFGLAEGAGAVIDDHTPFVAGGMPAIDLIDFEYGSAPGMNDYWHTPRDTLDKLSAQSLETVGRVVVRTLNELM